ncbi:MAG: hypothetical protein VKI81_05505 [Synechococcaceae cyanobacterium]|nr:hypothetical protein [Synechococcaceae cyanobacterium]
MVRLPAALSATAGFLLAAVPPALAQCQSSGWCVVPTTGDPAPSQAPLVKPLPHQGWLRQALRKDSASGREVRVVYDCMRWRYIVAGRDRAWKPIPPSSTEDAAARIVCK